MASKSADEQTPLEHEERQNTPVDDPAVDDMDPDVIESLRPFLSEEIIQWMQDNHLARALLSMEEKARNNS